MGGGLVVMRASGFWKGWRWAYEWGARVTPDVGCQAARRQCTLTCRKQTFSYGIIVPLSPPASPGQRGPPSASRSRAGLVEDGRGSRNAGQEGGDAQSRLRARRQGQAGRGSGSPRRAPERARLGAARGDGGGEDQIGEHPVVECEARLAVSEALPQRSAPVVEGKTRPPSAQSPVDEATVVPATRAPTGTGRRSPGARMALARVQPSRRPVPARRSELRFQPVQRSAASRRAPRPRWVARRSGATKTRASEARFFTIHQPTAPAAPPGRKTEARPIRRLGMARAKRKAARGTAKRRLPAGPAGGGPTPPER